MGSESAVGYKRPPTATQFKPGQSGNPNGRPKAATSSAVFLKKALARSVQHTENGIIKKVSRDEAIFLSLTAKAVKGDLKAIELVAGMKERFKLNQDVSPLTNIVVTFVDPDPEMLAAHEREDGLFDQLDREKQNSVVREIQHSESRK